MQRIILVRHAPSLGQKDNRYYGLHGDSRVGLDPSHAHLSVQCGSFLREYFEKTQTKTPPLFWTSQFLRTQQTYSGILQGLGNVFGDDVSWHQKRWHIDTLLNEQSFGFLPYIQHLKNSDDKNLAQNFAKLSAVLYSQDPFSSAPMMGDAPREVVANTRLFLSTTLQHDIDEGESDFVIISHGAVMKAIIMHWFHLYDLSSWKMIQTPNNCDVLVIDGSSKDWKVRQIYDGINAQPLLDKPINPISQIRRPNQNPPPELPLLDQSL